MRRVPDDVQCWILQVWLENIFIRLRRIPQDATQTETQVLSLSHISAWMTNITMQNDAGIAVALKLSLDAYVFMEGMGPHTCMPAEHFLCLKQCYTSHGGIFILKIRQKFTNYYICGFLAVELWPVFTRRS